MDSGILKKIDWVLVFLILPIITAGLFTMKSFAPTEGTGNFFEKQLIWVAVSLGVFFIFSFIDFRKIFFPPARRNQGLQAHFYFWFLYDTPRRFSSTAARLRLGHGASPHLAWPGVGFLDFQDASFICIS